MYTRLARRASESPIRLVNPSQCRLPSRQRLPSRNFRKIGVRARDVKPMPHRPWNYTIQYHHIVLRSVSAGCRLALDVGCGSGWVTQRLASRTEQVIGIDVDPEVLSLARSSSAPEGRIQYIEGDVMTYPFPAASFDFV